MLIVTQNYLDDTGIEDSQLKGLFSGGGGGGGLRFTHISAQKSFKIGLLGEKSHSKI